MNTQSTHPATLSRETTPLTAAATEEGFGTLSLDPRLLAGVKKCGFVRPTPIQAQAIPSLLQGRDMLGLAQTGTGKTAAFVLPILQRLLAGPRKRVRALVVAPTRELAEQIHANIRELARTTGLTSVVVYGGVGKQGQVTRIRKGAEIVVACPGRLLDLLRDRAVNLSAVEVLVLDEADHMFDKGFLPDIRRILKQLPAGRQTMIFSATMPGEVRHLAEEVLRQPVRVQIDHTRPAASITHGIFAVEQSAKTSLLKTLLRREELTTALVFTRTKHKAKQLAKQLEAAGFRATSLQGNLSQQKRKAALEGFKRGTFNVLVATDIAARGIDVSGISHVINYDMPDTVATYTHRTGRTGRASATGQAYTFAGRADRRMILEIERFLGRKMARQETPERMEAHTEPPSRGRAEARPRTSGRRSGPSHAFPKGRGERFDFGLGGRSRPRGGRPAKRVQAR